MKKLFTLLLALVTTTAIWAEDFEVGGIYYNIFNDNKVEVTYRGSFSDSYEEYSGFVTIPSTVTYNGTTYSVTSIGYKAFEDCSSLTSVTIGNSVTSIGDWAFAWCKSLTSVTIPNSVTSIGEAVFCACSSLTSVTIGNSVTSIGYEAFRECSKLTSVTIGNSVTSIGSGAFSYCTSLTSITIPNSVTSIGIGAFYGCTSLTSITIPNSVTSIGSEAFVGCTSLTSVTIPNSVTSIESGTFDDCSSLTSITIPNSVTSIGSEAFSDCESLTSVTIPNSVTSIGSDAFDGCSKLTSVTINSDAIVSNAYSDDSSISDIFGSQVTEYIIGEGVTSIGNNAFYYCYSLTSVTIPNSVTSIGNNAFQVCLTLTSITIPNSVTSIGSEAFSYCALTSVTIPNSVTSIGDYAFLSCSSLTSMVVETGNTTYDSRENCNAIIEKATNTLIAGCQNTFIPNSVTSIGEGAFADCSALTSITIPNSVTSIGDWAFMDCSSLTSVTIGNSVTSIGNSAFYACSKLTSVTIPNSVTSIGKEAFRYCTSLTSITCEAETPPTLGSDAFYGVSTSIPVYVPCGCASAYKVASGWKAFTNFQEPQAEHSIQVSTSNSQMGTAKVDYNTLCGAQISATANYRYHFVQWSDGNTDNPRTLVLTQDTVLTAEFALTIAGQCGDNLYWDYDKTNQTISITGSGDMYDYTAETQPWLLFKEEIKEVTVANTATSIGTSAFEGCIRLSKISLGTGLKNIAANAFAGCARLYDIYVYATYPPFAKESSFANYNVYVYIPCDYQRDYILDVVWGEFKFIECIGAESEDMGGDDVVVTPGTNDVTITWPTEDNANNYTIVIKKDGEVFCTLTFNAEGQLLNIAFAPGRNGNHPAQYAEQAANGGYRFTVTSLEEDTKYGYNLDVKNSASQTIKTYSGEFTTGATTSVEDIITNDNAAQKLLRDGQLIILRDGVEYNAQGQIIKE